MSSYQPPGGPQPDAGPPYVQPQDPWQGVASVPTDPIPYSQYAGNTGAWSQQTEIVGGPGYQYPPPQRGRVGLFVLVFLLVLVLGGGGGLATWWVVSNRNADPQATRSATPTVASSSSTGPETCVVGQGADAFDPCSVKVGDCIVNLGTPETPNVRFSACSAANAFKVIKLSRGPDIPENSKGKFDKDVTSVAVCKDTGYKAWYGYKDTYSDSRDLFLCLSRN